MNSNKHKKRIIVAMSGGVDSGTTAALLKKRGFEVHGVFLRLWKEIRTSKKDESLEDARKIAQALKIPFKVIDARNKFKKKIVEYFLKEYASGRTPNPCVVCNKDIKFEILFEEMRKLKTDGVATGHYANLRHSRLYEAKDKEKDQSYFLYRLKGEQLAKIIFPLGEYKKAEVKKLAKKFKLPVYEKEESQDICFLGRTDMKQFLKKNLRLKEGEIIDTKGKIIGRHQGLPLYTLGQRKGINIGGTGPYYVVAKNRKHNRLIVTNNKREERLNSKIAYLKEVNWISVEPKFPKRVLARTRYRNPLIYATISRESRKYKVEFEKPQWAVTSGQSAVFYSPKGEVLGGGVVV